MMDRFRFLVDDDDPRPVLWPLPVGCAWWHTGVNHDGKNVVVAYMPGQDVLMKYWPDAEEVDPYGKSPVIFTDRFPRPEWYRDPEPEGGEG